MDESGSQHQAFRPEGATGGTYSGRADALRAIAPNLLAVAREIEADEATSGSLILSGAKQPRRGVVDKAALLERAGQSYINRRNRRRFFPAELFGEPAWDLLLDLFRARLEDRMITVTSACLGADVPVSTALRWIGVLEAQGLVERSRNISDSRSTWVRLTDHATKAMAAYTESCLIRSRRADRLVEESLLALLPEESDPAGD